MVGKSKVKRELKLLVQVLCVDFFERVGCRKAKKERKGWLNNYFARNRRWKTIVWKRKK